VSTYDYQANSRATRLYDVDMFFWRERIYRGLAIAALDALLGWVMYLSATNRAFVTPPAPAERIEGTTRLLEAIRSKLSATGVVRNTVTRDEGLKARSQAYWTHEGTVMREVMEDREVMDGVNNALENRINIDRITADAGFYAESMMRGVQDLEGGE